MSTRSRIAIKRANNQIESIYCHHDGYPKYLGECLVKYYQDQYKIDDLMDLGDISSIGIYPIGEWHDFPTLPKKEKRTDKFYLACESYRARGEEDIDSILSENEDEFFELADATDAEFIYLYDNGKWFYQDIWGAVEDKKDRKWIELLTEDY